MWPIVVMIGANCVCSDPVPLLDKPNKDLHYPCINMHVVPALAPNCSSFCGRLNVPEIAVISGEVFPLLVEAKKLAYADLIRYIGDPKER